MKWPQGRTADEWLGVIIKAIALPPVPTFISVGCGKSVPAPYQKAKAPGMHWNANLVAICGRLSAKMTNTISVVPCHTACPAVAFNAPPLNLGGPVTGFG